MTTQTRHFHPQGRFPVDNGFATSPADYENIVSPSAYSQRSSISHSQASSPTSTAGHNSQRASFAYPNSQNHQQQQYQGPSFPYEHYQQQTGPPPTFNTMPSSVASFSSLDINLDETMAAMDSLTSDGMNFSTTDDSLFPNPPYFYPEGSSADFDSSPFVTSSGPMTGNTAMATSMDRLNSGTIIPGATLPHGQKVYAGIHQEHALQHQQALLAQQKREAEQKAQQAAQQAAQQQNPAHAKITKILESMMAKPGAVPHPNSVAKMLPHIAKLKKDEDEMDEDEKLLNSEEGKKMTSKERRQLRNKVSARAFRSRRKEYISTLETEVEKRTAENLQLKDRIANLENENKQLQNLTRTLLSSPAFSEFLDAMQIPTEEPAPVPQVPVEPPMETTLPKDINPNVNIESNTWAMPTYTNTAPTNLWNSTAVFAVTSLPEVPNLQDLSGKLTYKAPYSALPTVQEKEEIAFPPACDGYFSTSSSEDDASYAELPSWDELYGDAEYDEVNEQSVPENLMDLYESDCAPVSTEKEIPMHPAALEKFLASIESTLVSGADEDSDATESADEDSLVVPVEDVEMADANSTCAVQVRTTTQAFEQAEKVFKRVGLLCGGL